MEVDHLGNVDLNPVVPPFSSKYEFDKAPANTMIILSVIGLLVCFFTGIVATAAVWIFLIVTGYLRCRLYVAFLPEGLKWKILPVGSELFIPYTKIRSIVFDGNWVRMYVDLVGREKKYSLDLRSFPKQNGRQEVRCLFERIEELRKKHSEK